MLTLDYLAQVGVLAWFGLARFSGTNVYKAKTPEVYCEGTSTDAEITLKPLLSLSSLLR